MVGLPQFGFQAVILGLAPFLNGAQSMDKAIVSVGRSAYLLDRNTAGIGRNLDTANAKLQDAVKAADLANRRVTAAMTGTFATPIDREKATLQATLASIGAREAAEVGAAKTQLSNVRRQAQAVLTAEQESARNLVTNATQNAAQTTSVVTAAAKAQTASIVQEHRVQIADAEQASRRIQQFDVAAARAALQDRQAEIRDNTRQNLVNAKAANAPLGPVQESARAESFAATAVYTEQVNAAQRAHTERMRLEQGFHDAQIGLAKDAEAQTIAAVKGTEAATISVSQNIAAQQIAAAKVTEEATVAAATQTATRRVEVAQAGAASEAQIAKLRTTAIIASMNAEEARAEALAEREKALRGLAIGVGAAVGVAAATGFGISTIAAAKYEKTLVDVTAVGQLTAAGQQALSDEVIKLGRNSTLSIDEIAGGAGKLIKAGIDIHKVLGEGGALEVLNNLVVASGGELKMADAANAMVVSLNAFQKTGATAGQVASSLTAAIQKSSLEWNDWTAASNQGANAAAAAGLNVQEFNTVMGVVGQTIKSGSIAGAGLTQMFLRLSNEGSKAQEEAAKFGINLFDSEKKLRPFRDVLIDLEKVFGDQTNAVNKLTDADRLHALGAIFGIRAEKEAFALINGGVAAYDEIAAAANDANTVQNIAATQLSTTAAQWKIFTNNLDIAAVLVGTQLLPALNGMIRNLLDAAQAFPTSAVGQFGAAVVDLIGKLFNVVGAIKDFIQNNAAAQVAVAALAGIVSVQLTVNLVSMGAAAVKASALAVAGFLRMGVAATLALGPLGVLAAAFVTFGILVATHLDTVQHNIAELRLRVADFLDAMATAFQAIPGFGEAAASALRTAAINMHIGAIDMEEQSRKTTKDMQDLNAELAKLFNAPKGGPETTDPGVDENAKKAADLEKLFKDVNQSLDNLAADTTRKTTDIIEKTNQQIADAVKEADQQIKDENRQVSEQLADLSTNTAAKKSADDRKAALDQEISDQELARKQAREIDDASFKEARAAQDQALKDQQAAAERGFKDQLDAQALARKQQAEIDDAAFKAVLDAQSQFLKNQQEIESQALKDQQDAAERALKLLHDDQLAALKLSDDQVVKERENKLELLKIEQDYNDKLKDILDKANKDRADAQHAEEVRHAIAIRNAKTQTARDAEDRLHATRLAGVQTIGQADLDKAKTDFDRAMAEKKQEQAADAQTAQLKRNQDVEESNLKRKLDAEEVALKAKQEADSRALSAQHDAETQGLKAQQDAADFARKQALEVADAAFTAQQAAASQQFKDQLDANARTQKANADAEDLQRKQNQEIEDANTKAANNAKQRALEQQVADEDAARQRDRILRERDDRIDAIKQALANKQDQIKQQAADELKTVRENMDQQMRTIQEKVNDALPAILDGANQIIISRANVLGAALLNNLRIVRQQAFDTSQEIARALGLDQSLQTRLAIAAIPGYNGETLPTFAEGGVVPGLTGAPTLAIVHGGERFAGVHGESQHLMRPITSTAGLVQQAVNNSIVNYNVTAHYGRVQSEGSLLMDLRALAALRR